MILSGVFCNSQISYAQEINRVIDVEENTIITLEDGREVTAEEFLDILENYSGDIYKISDPELEAISRETNRGEYGVSSYSDGAMQIGDVMKIMAGTWYIPGIGKVVVAGGGIALYKVRGWIATQVKNWLTERALSKQSEKAVNGLGGVNSNKANHILQSKHNWSSLVPGGPKDQIDGIKSKKL